MDMNQLIASLNREKEQVEEKDYEEISIILFKMSGEEYGIDILAVQEIINPVNITHLPFTPRYILGLINLRGNIMSVIDLKQFLGMGSVSMDMNTKFVVVNVDGRIIGFAVDCILGVKNLPEFSIKAPPATIEHEKAQYISGVSYYEDRLITIISLDEILHSEKIEKFRKTEE